MSDYAKQFEGSCIDCGRKIVNLPHDIHTPYCPTCLGKLWDKRTADQAGILEEMNSNLKKMVALMEEANK